MANKTHADFYRPFHDRGPVVEAVRNQLAARAARFGAPKRGCAHRGRLIAKPTRHRKLRRTFASGFELDVLRLHLLSNRIDAPGAEHELVLVVDPAISIIRQPALPGTPACWPEEPAVPRAVARRSRDLDHQAAGLARDARLLAGGARRPPDEACRQVRAPAVS